ncbi:MAG: radical SAM protein [Candidatus Magnetobacterium sp. LHC-1]
MIESDRANKFLKAPLSVIFAITDRCNLSCIHCLAKEESSNGDLHIEQIRKILKELSDMKVFNLTLFGGEPFVRTDIFDIIDAIQMYPIGIAVNTNGTFITKKIAKELKQRKIKVFTVSLDGSQEEVFSKIRGKGTFKKVVEGIVNLLEIEADVLISTTVFKPNIHDISDIAAFAKELGVSGVRFNHVFYTGNACCYLDDLCLNPSEQRSVIDNLLALKKIYGNFVSGSYMQTAEMVDNLNEYERSDKITVHPCGAAMNKCAIKSNGSVVPCEILWTLDAGNILKTPFKDIWMNSPVMNKFRKSIILTDEDIGKCMDCSKRFICYTGHRCNPYYYPDGLKRNDIYCIEYSE